MTFTQGQIILNAYYAAEFYPFVFPSRPSHRLPEPERDAMLERIRSAKARLIPAGTVVSREIFRKLADQALPFELTAAELEDVIVVLERVLAEGQLDPLNIEPMVGGGLNIGGTGLDAMASLLQSLRNAGP